MAFKLDKTTWERVSIPENSRPPGSANASLHEMPVRRVTIHDIKGMILFLPRSGLIITPTRIVAGGWYCAVVRGTTTYPRGGYNLHVSDWELYRAEEVWIGTFNPSEPYAVRSSIGLGIFTMTPTPDIGTPPENEGSGDSVPVDPITLFYTLPKEGEADGSDSRHRA